MPVPSLGVATTKGEGPRGRIGGTTGFCWMTALSILLSIALARGARSLGRQRGWTAFSGVWPEAATGVSTQCQQLSPGTDQQCKGKKWKWFLPRTTSRRIKKVGHLVGAGTQYAWMVVGVGGDSRSGQLLAAGQDDTGLFWASPSGQQAAWCQKLLPGSPSTPMSLPEGFASCCQNPQFPCQDIREEQLEKTVAYAQALQFWVEKSNPPTRGQPCLWWGASWSWRAVMEPYISFPNDAILDGVAPPEGFWEDQPETTISRSAQPAPTEPPPIEQAAAEEATPHWEASGGAQYLPDPKWGASQEGRVPNLVPWVEGSVTSLQATYGHWTGPSNPPRVEMEALQPEFWEKEDSTLKGRGASVEWKYKAQAHIVNWASGNCMGSGTTSGLPGSDGLSAERPITGGCLQGTPRTPAARSGNWTYCGHDVSTLYRTRPWGWCMWIPSPPLWGMWPLGTPAWQLQDLT